MKSVIEKFLKYVSYDTTSDEDSASYPSTEKQLVLLAELKNELAALGLDAKMDEHGYVTATLAANGTLSGKKICFISHVDTSPAVSGANVKPQIIRYEGGDVVLNEEKNVVFSAAEYPEISAYVGQQIIFTDGIMSFSNISGRFCPIGNGAGKLLQFNFGMEIPGRSCRSIFQNEDQASLSWGKRKIEITFKYVHPIQFGFVRS